MLTEPHPITSETPRSAAQIRAAFNNLATQSLPLPMMLEKFEHLWSEASQGAASAFSDEAISGYLPLLTEMDTWYTEQRKRPSGCRGDPTCCGLSALSDSAFLNEFRMVAALGRLPRLRHEELSDASPIPFAARFSVSNAAGSAHARPRENLLAPEAPDVDPFAPAALGVPIPVPPCPALPPAVPPPVPN